MYATTAQNLTKALEELKCARKEGNRVDEYKSLNAVANMVRDFVKMKANNQLSEI